MDIEKLPSGKFESNKLVLELNMIAYNILPIIGQELPKKSITLFEKKCIAVGYGRSSVT